MYGIIISVLYFCSHCVQDKRALFITYLWNKNGLFSSLLFAHSSSFHNRA